jgi:penicillin-binding protein 2
MRIISQIRKIDESELKILKKRLDITSAIYLFFIAILVFRLWYLQIHCGADYSVSAEKNRIRSQDIIAPRGTIFDRKDRKIISNRPSFNIVWLKEDSPDPDVILKKLSAILDEDISILLERIRKSADHPRFFPIRLKEDIDWKTLVYIENHHFQLPGIRIEPLPVRQYLYGDLASHLIGYLGEINTEELRKSSRKDNYKPGNLIGKVGIEKQFEKQLRGEKGRRFVEVDVHGYEQKQLELHKPLPGIDLGITIDIDLQSVAEQALTGKAGAAVAVEVNTGRVLALASSPPLRLEEFIGGISAQVYKDMLDNPLRPFFDKAIKGQYPPGSTYKVITAYAGLAEKQITTSTVFYCNGSLKFGRRRYNCWKRRGHGATSLNRALAESCDVYFYQVGKKLGVDKLAYYAEQFGLGTKTGIGLLHEKNGLVPTSAWKRKRHKTAWQDGETLSVAIGQGFNLATPLQICQMTAVLANGGILYRPQFIEKIIHPDDSISSTLKPIIDHRILDNPNHSAHLAVIRQGLITAVNHKKGTGGKAKMDDILVAGKTGTAQVVKVAQYRHMKEQDIPYKYRDHAWFTCFAPADKPLIAVTVLVEHGLHGGSAAAPIAKLIMKKYFQSKTKKQ